MKSNNPFKRLKEIDSELLPLEKEEKEFMNKKYKIKPERYTNVENEIFFLIIEKLQIEKLISYFRRRFDKIDKKYPEHYWKWQFFGKVLYPDEIVEEKNKHGKTN